VQSFKLKFLGVTILQGVEFPIFLLIFACALQQCSAVLPSYRRLLQTGITESSTDPPANLVGDAFGKRRPVGQCDGRERYCRDDWLRVGTWYGDVNSGA